MSKEARTIGQLAKELQPRMKICITFDWWKDDEGNQKWSTPLSDAQIIAYQNHRIESQRQTDNTYFVKLSTENE